MTNIRRAPEYSKEARFSCFNAIVKTADGNHMSACSKQIRAIFLSENYPGSSTMHIIARKKLNFSFFFFLGAPKYKSKVSTIYFRLQLTLFPFPMKVPSSVHFTTATPSCRFQAVGWVSGLVERACSVSVLGLPPFLPCSLQLQQELAWQL